MQLKTLGLMAGAAAVLTLAQPAAAMDMAKVHAHEPLDIASTQAAEVCAASTMGAAYMAPKGSDEATLNTTLGRAWVKLAIQATGKDANDYIDHILTANMQALYDDGNDTVKFYHDACLVASKQLLNS